MRIFLALVSLLFASQSFAAYVVSGSGVIEEAASGIGVVGETVTFSFAYDPNSFSSLSGNTYQSLTPMEVTAVGSISGSLAVNAFTGVAVYDSFFDQLNFVGSTNALIQFTDGSGAALSGTPASFTGVHAEFIDSWNNTSLWSPGSTMALGVGEFNETLLLNSYTVDIQAVPVPAAVWLFGSALMGLGWVRRSRAS